jgi:uncharacterized membrane protein YdbT with pleckstrin-like domain
MEHTIYQGRTSLIKYWFVVGVGSLMVAAGIQLVNSPGAEQTGYFFALPGLFLVGVAYLNTTATSYTVTSRRVIQRKGLFSPRTTEVEISDIRSVQVDQNSTERLFGIGNVGIARAGRPGTEIVFTGIRNPKQVAEMIPGRRRKPAQRGPRARLTQM